VGLRFATANNFTWGTHLAGLGKPHPAGCTKFIGALAQQQRRPAQNGKVEGANPSRATSFAHVVQRRDGALKTRTVSVQIRSWAPSACSPRQRRSAQTGKFAGALQFAKANSPILGPLTRNAWEAHSCHADQFGMSTGQANRASVLTSACPLGKWCTAVRDSEPSHFGNPSCRAWEATLHGIPPSACSSKGTVRLINGIALDECRVREHYPARRPFSPP
jgi:hypothetical protein